MTKFKDEKAVIGFIGTGVMGKSMVRHLLLGGYEVVIYNRTKKKAEDLLKEGANWGSTPKDVAERSHIIITMVGYPSDVENLYLGEEGIIHNCKTGCILIDMTTSSPTLARKIHKIGSERGIFTLDAPVSGGDIGAREGKLSIMVGGELEQFEKVKPLLNLLGTNVIYQGESGAGQHTKMCNQITIASNMIGVSEALVYAKKSGLNPDTVLKSITSGAAGSWSLSNLVPRMIQEDFTPGFYVKHFIKDLKIALESAKEMGIKTPGLELALSMYEELALKGEENSGTQAIIKLLEE
ncbi:NAD(P)-dependent oxidoreductase [Rossellomorea aquimaris]|uniref:NAD(P)-dependent oxidoreductase n=1 Tax=Rossellomorea aquimaris TaxID=189382 RepID=UPI0007D0519D|nr:NAD(P)-dependent oxidoreductase [Rossellomorea aquimaris]